MRTNWVYFAIQLLGINVTYAAFFNVDGDVISGGSVVSPNLQFDLVVYDSRSQQPPFNGTFFVSKSDGSSCAGFIVKSWEGSDAPPSDLNVVAITSGTCLSFILTTIADGKMIQDHIFSSADTNDYSFGKVLFKRYKQLGSNFDNNLVTSIQKVDFAISDLIDVAVISLGIKAIDLYTEKYTFYQIGSQALPANTDIFNIGFYDTDNLSYYMRKMTGEFLVQYQE